MSKDKDTHLRCRLVPTGVVKLGKREEVSGIIRNLNYSESEEELRTKRPGSVILRLDKDAMRQGQKTISLIISYKFKTTIYHRHLKDIKITAKQKKDEILCRTSPNTFKNVNEKLINFLKKLLIFVSAIVRNKNWIEKELQLVEIERLLTFQEFIIFPSRGLIIIIRKTRQSNKALSHHKDLPIIIDFDKYGFFVFKNNDVLGSSEDDFNKILFSFMEIDENKSNSLLTFKSLGYDLEAFRKEMEDDEQLRNLTKESLEPESSIDVKEKTVLLSIIDLELETVEVGLLEKIPEPVSETFFKIALAVKSLSEIPTNCTTPEEHQARCDNSKMEWIRHGIFRTLFKYFCLCGKTTFPKRYDYPLEICQNLLSNFQPGCRLFHSTFWRFVDNILNGDTSKIEDYVGLFYVLPKLITVKPLGMVFLKESGMPRLISLYIQISNSLADQKRARLNVDFPSMKEILGKPNKIFNARMIAQQTNAETPNRRRTASTPTSKYKIPNKTSPRRITLKKSVGSPSPTRARPTHRVTDGESHSPEEDVSPSTSPPRSPSPPLERKKTPTDKRQNFRKAFSEHSTTLGRTGLKPPVSTLDTKNKTEDIREEEVIQDDHKNDEQNFENEKETDKETDKELEKEVEKEEPEIDEPIIIASLSSLAVVPSPRIRGTLGIKLNLPPSIVQGPASPKVPVIQSLSLNSPKEKDPNSTRRTITTPKKHSSALSHRSAPNYLSEFKDLAKKIGETYVSADLTSLLSFKYEADINKKKTQTTSTSQETTRLQKTTQEKKITIETDPAEQWCPEHKIKCGILRSLGVLSESSDFKRLSRNPMNLFYTELFSSYSSPTLTTAEEDALRSLIYPILSNLSEQVEIDHHLHRWQQITEQMGDDLKGSFRQKMDLMLWRIRQRLIAEGLKEDLRGITVQLRILGDYLSHCRTRVMATQVTDVCFEILLKIKVFLTLGPYPDAKNLERLELCHALLQVSDVVMERSLFAPLNDLLLTTFISKQETFEWIEHYAIQVLMNKEFEKEVTKTFSAKFLEELRLQVLFHYKCCILLIKKQFTGATTKIELVQKMEFLIYPNTGIIQRLLADEQISFSIKKSLLTLEHKMLALRDKDSPLLTTGCIDSYISFHYVHFLLLYHNYSIDEQTLLLCRKHLRILTDFAMQKDEQIKQKFYQLKVVAFLTREINLEYEVKIMCKNFLEEQKEEEKKALQALPPSIQLAKPKTESKRKLLETGTEKKQAKPASSSEESGSSESPKAKPVITKGLLKLNILGLEKGGPNPTSTQKSEESSEEEESSEASSPKKPVFGKLKINISGLEKGGPSPVIPKTGDSASEEGSEEEESEPESPKKPETPKRPIIPKGALKISITGLEKGGPNPVLKKEDSGEDGSGSEEDGSGSGDGGGSEEETEESPKKPAFKINILGLEKGGATQQVAAAPSLPLPQKGGISMSLKIPPEAAKGGVETKPKEDATVVAKGGLGLKLPPSLIKGTTAGTTDDKKGNEAGGGVSLKVSEKKEGEEEGSRFLTNIQNAMQSTKQQKKMQDLLVQGQQEQENEQQSKQDEIEESIYKNERLNRKLYYDDKLHAGFLELILILLIAPNGFTLDHLYTNQFPMRILKINVPFIVRLHLNHPANAPILGCLAYKTQKLNPSAFRMLKLFSNRFFQPSLLSDLNLFASGAYGRVYGCRLLGEEVAVKQMDVPQSIQDRCVPHDIFTEITILDRWKADERICRLIDYGVDDNYFWIVMKRYTTSLKDWREKQKKSVEENLLLYLNIYSNVLQNSRFLEENMVNHYDIKCDNFLIYPTSNPLLTKEELYNQTTDIPNFSVCLADFGES